MPAVALCVALAAGLGGCGLDRKADDPTTSMPAPPPARPALRRLRVVAVVDEGWQALPRFERRTRETIERASAFLLGQFGLELELVRLAPWPADDGQVERLAALEAAVPAPAADLVLGFTAAAPPRRPSMPLLARSRYAGRHAVLYGLGRYHAETGARRAAEVRALLHAIARIYGALPACTGIMTARPPLQLADRGQWRWGSTNLKLIKAHRGVDLRPAAAGASRVPADVAEAARRILMVPGRDLRCDLPAVDARRILLAEVMSATTRAARIEETGATLLADDAPTDTRELDAVAAAEKALADDPGGAFETCRPIADRAPAVGARCAGRAAEALGLHEDAVRYYRAWLAHHAEDEATLLSLAREVGRDGDDEAARALLARAVAEHPGFVEARLNLGIALARLGRYPEARATWQALLERAPDHAEARRLLAELDAQVPPAKR